MHGHYDHFEIGGGSGNNPDWTAGELGPIETNVGVDMNNVEIGNLEIGGEDAHDIRKVVETARDNRAPAPKMRAVAVDEPEHEDDVFCSWFLDVAIGCGEAIGVADPFPLTSALLQRFGAGRDKPRYVRIDTEESYNAFLASGSEEMAAFQDSLRQVHDMLVDHVNDPSAHDDLLDAIDEAESLGAEAQADRERKKIDLWLPEGFDDKVDAWQDGDFICASIRLPGADGNVRVCTSAMPVDKAIEEMEGHAADAGVSAASVIGCLPAMGCTLGAGTLVKEMAAAAPSILARPEAAGSKPFVCRIEPKANPALCALIALFQECACGNKQACAEWDALADAANRGGGTYIKQAMVEAKNLFSKAKK